MAILIFENNAILANDIKKNLIGERYDTLLIRVPSELPKDDEFWQGIELIILDLMMGNVELPMDWKMKSENGLITGYVVYENMCPNKDIPVLVLTGLKNETLLKEVEKSIKRCAVVRKPINYDKFLHTVKKLLER